MPCDGATLVHGVVLGSIVVVLLVLLSVDIWFWVIRDVPQQCRVDMTSGDVVDLLGGSTTSEMLALVEDLLVEPRNQHIEGQFCDATEGGEGAIRCLSGTDFPPLRQAYASAENLFIPTAALVQNHSARSQDYRVKDAWRTLVQLQPLVGTASSVSYRSLASKSPFETTWQDNTALQIKSSRSSSTENNLVQSCIDYQAVQELSGYLKSGNRIAARGLLQSWENAEGGLPRTACIQKSPQDPLVLDLVTIFDALGIQGSDTNTVLSASLTAGRVRDVGFFDAVFGADSAVASVDQQNFYSTGVCVTLDTVVLKSWPPKYDRVDEGALSATDVDGYSRNGAVVFSQVPCELGLPSRDGQLWQVYTDTDPSHLRKTIFAMRGLSLQSFCRIETTFLALWSHVLAAAALGIALSIMAHLILAAQVQRSCCSYNAVRRWEKYLHAREAARATTRVEQRTDHSPQSRRSSKRDEARMRRLEMMSLDTTQELSGTNNKGQGHFSHNSASIVLTVNGSPPGTPGESPTSADASSRNESPLSANDQSEAETSDSMSVGPARRVRSNSSDADNRGEINGSDEDATDTSMSVGTNHHRRRSSSSSTLDEIKKSQSDILRKIVPRARVSSSSFSDEADRTTDDGTLSVGARARALSASTVSADSSDVDSPASRKSSGNAHANRGTRGSDDESLSVDGSLSIDVNSDDVSMSVGGESVQSIDERPFTGSQRMLSAAPSTRDDPRGDKLPTKPKIHSQSSPTAVKQQPEVSPSPNQQLPSQSPLGTRPPELSVDTSKPSTSLSGRRPPKLADPSLISPMLLSIDELKHPSQRINSSFRPRVTTEEHENGGYDSDLYLPTDSEESVESFSNAGIYMPTESDTTATDVDSTDGEERPHATNALKSGSDSSPQSSKWPRPPLGSNLRFSEQLGTTDSGAKERDRSSHAEKPKKKKKTRKRRAGSKRHVPAGGLEPILEENRGLPGGSLEEYDTSSDDSARHTHGAKASPGGSKKSAGTTNRGNSVGTPKRVIGPLETELISQAAVDFLSKSSPRSLHSTDSELIERVLDYVNDQLAQNYVVSGPAAVMVESIIDRQRRRQAHSHLGRRVDYI